MFNQYSMYIISRDMIKQYTIFEHSQIKYHLLILSSIIEAHLVPAVAEVELEPASFPTSREPAGEAPGLLEEREGVPTLLEGVPARIIVRSSPLSKRCRSSA